MPYSTEEEARFEDQRDVLKRSFNEVAEQYAAARPDYPEALFATIVRLARLSFDARLLEIGAGPGIATRHFAARGYPIIALEPGDALAEVARRRLAAFPHVAVLNQTFEAWPLERGGFDLVYAAQAFHWVDRTVAYAKTAAALRPGGAAALFWNRPVDGPTPAGAALDEAYRRHAPELARRGAPDPLDEWLDTHSAAINGCGLFEPVLVRTFPWTARYSADHYAALLGTYSDHITLEPQARAALLDDIRGIVAAQEDGLLRRHYVAALFFARVAR